MTPTTSVSIELLLVLQTTHNIMSYMEQKRAGTHITDFEAVNITVSCVRER